MSGIDCLSHYCTVVRYQHLKSDLTCELLSSCEPPNEVWVESWVVYFTSSTWRGRRCTPEYSEWRLYSRVSAAKTRGLWTKTKFFVQCNYVSCVQNKYAGPLYCRAEMNACRMLPPGESRWVCASRPTEIRKKMGQTYDARPIHYAYRWTRPV